MDTGASHHLTSRQDDLTVTSDHEFAVKAADGRTLAAKGKGHLCVRALVQDNSGNEIQGDFVIKDVYFVPTIRRTLPSVSALLRAG